MKGFIAKTLGMVCVTAGLAACVGCGPRYQNVVDPCYPQRYNAMARSEVREGLDAQASNGHMLDQTMWNYHFEPGSARLTVGGIAKLEQMNRRRPHPDPKIYLQTARDIPYDPAAPQKLNQTRSALDKERIASIQKFLDSESASQAGGFEVAVHDPMPVGLPGMMQNNSVRMRYLAGPGGTLPSTSAVPAFTPTGLTGAW